MIKTYIPLTVFSVLFLLLLPFVFITLYLDYSSSYLPGWHISVNPFYFTVNAIKFLVLSLSLLGYWKIKKQIEEISLNFFTIHLILTIPAIINLDLVLQSFIEFKIGSLEQMERQIETLENITSVADMLFIIGQIYFWINYIAIFKNKATANTC